MGRRAHRAAAPGDTPDTPPDDPVGGSSGEVPDASMIAGYRVVRRLGSGRRAVVYLGHAGPAAGPPEAEGSGRAVNVALKVFGPEADPASVEREIRALSRCPAGLLPALLDVATLPDGRVCLVLERLAGTSLSRHLARADTIRPGEAVTILAPVVTALAALHEAGFAHDGLSQASVLFDASGRPVLAGLGGLRDLPPAGKPRIPALRANYLRLGMLVRGVFDCLDAEDQASPAAEQLASWFEDATRAAPFRPCLDGLERRLFDWATATPVRRPGLVVGEARPNRGPGVGPRRGGPGVGPRTPVPPQARPLPAWLGFLHLPPELVTALGTKPGTALAGALTGALTGHPVERGLSRLRDRVRLRRRPLSLAAVVAAGLVLLALGLLPAPSGTDASGTNSSDANSSDASAAGRAEEGADSATVDPEGRGPVDATDAAALAGDDPVRAVPVLLRLRAGCLARASVVCLDGVDQPGSAVLAADTYAARTAQQGGGAADPHAFDGYAASLVERIGNSALVALAPPADPSPSAEPSGPPGRPASVLAVKGEGGWLLREIFDY